MKTLKALSIFGLVLLSLSVLTLTKAEAPSSTPNVELYLIKPSTTTTTTRPPVTTCDQAIALSIKAGFPKAQLKTARKVLYSESRCLETAINLNDTVAGHSYSLYQINAFWCKPNRYTKQGWLIDAKIIKNCYDLRDPWKNTQAAYAIWSNFGWSPWRVR